jgi:AcrR family transcriptional regulator
MGSRRYRLGRRGEAAEETRQRIVEATFALHAEQGIAATSMKQIAERAGVSVGTVYHHFPTYEDAIRACGAYTLATIPPPTNAVFAEIRSPEDHLERLAVEIFGWFERLPVFERVRCDQDRLPILRPFVEAEEQNRIALMREALQPLGVEEDQVKTAASLLDMGVYRGLRRAGLSTPEAARRIADVIVSWLSPHRPFFDRR